MGRSNEKSHDRDGEEKDNRQTKETWVGATRNHLTAKDLMESMALYRVVKNLV